MAGKSRRKSKPQPDLQDDQERSSAQTESMDEFVRQMHGTTPTGSANGMPSLDVLKAKFKTKSACIRHLHIDRGFKVKDIAKHLGLRYQHVRNVLKTELKRGPNEDFHLGEGQAAGVIKSETEPNPNRNES